MRIFDRLFKKRSEARTATSAKRLLLMFVNKERALVSIERARARQFGLAQPPAGRALDNGWYGLTFELKEDVSHDELLGFCRDLVDYQVRACAVAGYPAATQRELLTIFDLKGIELK